VRSIGTYDCGVVSSPEDLIPSPGDPLPTGVDKTRSVEAMFDAIAPRYDFVNRLMTFRMDVGWRKRTLACLALPPGSTVVDLACGTGDLAAALQSRGFHVVGVDLSFGMLDSAPVGFNRLQADGSALPMRDSSADGLTCGFALRNFTDLSSTLAEVARVVRPGGRIALLEVAEPPNPLMRFGHGIYFNHVVPLIGGLVSNRDAYAYLPRSVAYLPEPERLLQDIREAGFNHVERRLLSGGISQLITATRTR
jgi:demethylmenaquinone methyltransferase/2-methoxy-6-polyprenyl-1,4-benzoquinol methylase